MSNKCFNYEMFFAFDRVVQATTRDKSKRKNKKVEISLFKKYWV